MIEQFNLMRILRAAQLLTRSYPVYIWASSEGIWVVGANESEKQNYFNRFRIKTLRILLYDGDKKIELCTYFFLVNY